MPQLPVVDVSVADLLVDAFSTRVAIGHAEAVPAFRRAIAALSSAEVGTEVVPRWSSFASLAAHELWDDVNHRALLTRFEQVDRNQGALNSLRVTLVALGSCAMYEGQFAAAAAYHAEACDITAAIGGDTTLWSLMNVELLAWQGRARETREAVDALMRTSTDRGVGSALNIASIAMTILEVGDGHYADALAHARRVLDDDPPAFGNQVLPTVVEAGARIGDIETAALALERLAERATVTGTPWALGLLARARALIEGDSKAESLYQEAIALLERTVIKTDLARARLLYGEWLRRQNRRVEARDQLRAAHDAFSAMGAGLFANRAQIELAATGEHARKRNVESNDELTPQEAQVANLAAYGATNSEIAAQLFISPNTVEYHLRKVFRKLQISSRRNLARVL
jgi:DNA-binding CsgD family transcriptional regulator